MVSSISISRTAGSIGDVLRQIDQIIRCISHRRDDNDDFMSFFFLRYDSFGDTLHSLRIADGAAAEFHYD